MKPNHSMHFTAQYLLETWCDMSSRLLQNPETLVNRQLQYWQECQTLFQNTQQNNFLALDKRFQSTEWQDYIAFNFIKRSYELISQHVEPLINTVAQEDEHIGKKLNFFTQQFLNALAPTNFAYTNPEVISKTLETNGKNLLDGFRQFLDDLERGGGHLKMQMTDTTFFELGKNIACTPGKIIYQNDLMQLIQYTATTEQVFQYPLLMMPAWVNKYYILDLQQENSLVKWLVDQGITVFMISWVNPTTQHKHKKFSDYMHEGPLSAIKIIRTITRKQQVNLLGYCIGGTLLACTLAYLAKKKISCIRSATFLTTLLDFSEPGELGIFIDDKQIEMIEKNMATTGYLDGNVMSTIFSSLRANDLIWSTFVNQYLKGQKPKPFDLLYWNSDSMNIPEHVHSFYLRNMYLHNHLTQPNKIKISGKTLDLAEIYTPCYFLATQGDHIVPWQSSYQSSQYFSGMTRFVLATSGHVAGVINPPSKNKYGYWINDKNPKAAEDFLKSAAFQAGSWWNDWAFWLKQYSGKLQPVCHLNFSAQTIIEDAPGTYVRVQIAN